MYMYIYIYIYIYTYTYIYIYKYISRTTLAVRRWWWVGGTTKVLATSPRRPERVCSCPRSEGDLPFSKQSIWPPPPTWFDSPPPIWFVSPPLSDLIPSPLYRVYYPPLCATCRLHCGHSLGPRGFYSFQHTRAPSVERILTLSVRFRKNRFDPPPLHGWAYLTESVYKVVLRKSIPAKIRELIL